MPATGSSPWQVLTLRRLVAGFLAAFARFGRTSSAALGMLRLTTSSRWLTRSASPLAAAAWRAWPTSARASAILPLTPRAPATLSRASPKSERSGSTTGSFVSPRRAAPEACPALDDASCRLLAALRCSMSLTGHMGPRLPRLRRGKVAIDALGRLLAPPLLSFDGIGNDKWKFVH